jgi:predicted lipoprotein with Yx(FWY)xxD motif
LDKETKFMEQTKPHRGATRRASIGRAAAAVVAAGGLSASLFATSPANAATGHPAKGVVISTLKTKKDGTVLVSGETLYTLKPSKTPCAAACQKIWPEVLLPKGVMKATAGPGVSAAKLGTVTGAGGALQVTYAGKPLYWFIGDKAPGQVNGNVTDMWGTWSDVGTVKPAANPGTGGVAF